MVSVLWIKTKLGTGSEEIDELKKGKKPGKD